MESVSDIAGAAGESGKSRTTSKSSIKLCHGPAVPVPVSQSPTRSLSLPRASSESDSDTHCGRLRLLLRLLA
jgi:hypothetical protein